METTTEDNIITDSIHHRIQVRHNHDDDDDSSAISTFNSPLFVVITTLINLWYLMNGNL